MTVLRRAAVAWLMWLGFATLGVADTGLVRVVEYEWRDWGTGARRFFMTAHPHEIAALDATRGAIDWFRTGVEFRAHATGGLDRVPVCRFASTGRGNIGAHFFSAFAEECTALAGGAHWVSEGDAFHVVLPHLDGSCPQGTAPMYRLHDGRSHRLTYLNGWHDVEVPETVVAEGRGPEGVAMCIPSLQDEAPARLLAFARGTWEFDLGPVTQPYPAPARIWFGDTPLADGHNVWVLPGAGASILARGAGAYQPVPFNLVGNVAAEVGWQPFTGEVVVVLTRHTPAEIVLRLVHAGGDTVEGCWFRPGLVDLGWGWVYHWSEPCQPLTGRRR